jgi:hypothetical protein
LLIAKNSNIAGGSGPARHKSCGVDRRHRQGVRFSIHFDHNALVIRGHQRAPETASPFYRETHLHFHGFASKPLKMLNFR